MVMAYVAATFPAQAAQTDLASQPLANIAGTAAVKPNIMFLLDDSGSMMQQYTPDYVSERWGTPATSDMHCLNSGDSSYVARPGLTINDSNANRDLCLVGDPPYMSPDFNKQYYNPEISYTPPITWNGTPYQSQTAASTANLDLCQNRRFQRPEYRSARTKCHHEKSDYPVPRTGILQQSGRIALRHC